MTRTFVSERLNLPLFLVSRNRIKQHSLPRLRTYIWKRKKLYVKDCSKDQQEQEDAEQGVSNPCTDIPECPKRVRIISRTLINKCPWCVRPNRYLLPTELFTKQKGYFGAFWPKGPRFPEPSKRHKGPPLFYNYRIGRNRYPNCDTYKYVIQPDCRQNRPSSRLMLIDINGCWRDPNFPGPATYDLTTYRNVTKGIKPPETYRFLRNSCVPAKENSIHPPNTSFLPAPGRYEIYDSIGYPCPKDKIFVANIYYEVAKQKRCKFRRIKYPKVVCNKYCSAAWRRVEGHGHTYRFKFGSTDADKLAEAKKKDVATPHNYADARYINMINNPIRKNFSIRESKIPIDLTKIHFNTMAKRTMRKVTMANKKVAFGSSQKRWPDADDQPGVGAPDEMLITSPEKIIKDQPVMRLSPSQIKTKFLGVPMRLQCQSTVVRTQTFKFSAMPTAEVLVRESDVMVESKTSAGTPLRLYGKEISPEQFFKN